MTNTDTSLKPSTLAIPPRDERDAAIKSLESKCREIVNLANDVRMAARALEDAGCEDKAALVKVAMKFGGLRERLYNLKDEIERDLRHYNLDCDFNISVSHTQDGLPIRVDKARKIPLWGL